MADFNGQLISIVGRSKKNTTNLCQLNHDVHTFGHHKKKNKLKRNEREKKTRNMNVCLDLLRFSHLISVNKLDYFLCL